ncbi:ROK family protein [Candidatus Poribacteria bacterium]|nr:ROK family protein [Candidatus Poribacteria bacterium]MXV84982.1 ROK family protein [Candidatus Poribacteria bacterium]MYA56910.1 ROK family protein [Candidatus Poribacteria bacterium]
MKEYVVGIDIGGTKLATVVADKTGHILGKVRKPTHSEKGPEYAIGLLFDMVREVVNQVGVEQTSISAIGVSCGGPLDTKTGIVYSPPNLPGWDALPLKALLESEFQVPVIIENDANASALAEFRFGGGRGYSAVLYMTMSTGIGGGIVIDGQVYHGANDSAGEVGHQILLPNGPRCGCGKRGCLEALCSGPAIARRAQAALRKQRKGGKSPTALLTLADGQIEAVKSEHVLAAARTGDALALELVQETAYYMGWGIANLVNILNPDIVLLGTIAVAAGDLLLDPIRETVSKFAMPRPAEAVNIAPAELGDALGDLAAVALVV